MVDDVAARLAAFEGIHCIAREIRHGGVRLLGTSGTVTTLAGAAMGLVRYRRPLVDGAVLTAEDQLRATDSGA
jgi:exopolyphosphatase/guanosine-5'-triphosphate,3'-diphosphate pyrophosphatase